MHARFVYWECEYVLWFRYKNYATKCKHSLLNGNIMWFKIARRRWAISDIPLFLNTKNIHLIWLMHKASLKLIVDGLFSFRLYKIDIFHIHSSEGSIWPIFRLFLTSNEKFHCFCCFICFRDSDMYYIKAFSFRMWNALAAREYVLSLDWKLATKFL